MANHKLVLGHGQNHHNFCQDNGLGLGYGHDHELVLGQSHDESTTTWRHRVGCGGTAGAGGEQRRGKEESGEWARFGHAGWTK